MSEIVNVKDLFIMESGVFASSFIPMGQRDLEVFGAGTPVTHWFIVGCDSDIVCFATDAAGNGHIEAPDYEIKSIRYNKEGEFRRILCQACTNGLDELIRG